MSEWVSVDDRLPSEAQMVLCYVPLSYNGYRGIHYGWLSTRLDFHGRPNGQVWKEHSPHSYAHDMEDERHTGTSGSVVTHWMAMPSTPPAAEPEGGR